MNRKFGRLFIKLFIPYFFVIIVLFALSSIAYVTAFKVIENNTLKMQESYIEQSKSVLDRRFKEAIDASYQLKEIPIVMAFKKKTAEELDENYYPAAELYNSLQKLRFVNEIINEYYIFYKESNMVASPQGVYKYENFGEEALKTFGYNKKEFWDGLFESFYSDEFLPVQDFNVYKSFVRGIPVMNTLGYDVNNPKATIFMILDGDKLRENMTAFAQNFQGNFFIVNEDNEILISLNDDYNLSNDGQIDEKRMEKESVIVASESEVIPCKYILMQPSDKVFQEINMLRDSANSFFFIIFLIGLVISLILAHINSKPVVNLMSSNEMLTERVKNHLPYLRMTFLERWLKGNYTNLDEIVSITKFLKAKYLGDYYCVMVVDYDEHINVLEEVNETNINELEMKRIIVKDLLTEDILKPEYIHDIDHDKFAVIFISDGQTEDAFRTYVREQVNRCRETLVSREVGDIHYGIGKIYDDMSNVSVSLINALDAISISNAQDDGCITYYESLGENTDIYYFPPEIETRLYNCTRAGDSEQVIQLLREILKKNVLDRTLPNYMQKVFIYEIWGTLAKIQERAVGSDNIVNEMIKTAFEKLDSMSDLEKIQYCKQIFIEVSEVFSNKRRDRHELIMDKINTYIIDHFSDPDFCLPLVADEFNLSYTYLSQIFKDYNGESFINYLQQLRMEEAERLLTETKMPVKDIVAACGYNSCNTFGKAFKRNHGVSASVYREKQRTASVN